MNITEIIEKFEKIISQPYCEEAAMANNPTPVEEAKDFLRKEISTLLDSLKMEEMNLDEFHDENNWKTRYYNLAVQEFNNKLNKIRE